MRIRWTEKTNDFTLGMAAAKGRLLTVISCRKMAFIEGLLRGKDVSKDIFLSTVYGKRRRGSSKVKCCNNVKEITGQRDMV